MLYDTRTILLGHVRFTGEESVSFPEGYETEEATEALVALLVPEAERQAFAAKVASAPILSVEEAYGA